MVEQTHGRDQKAPIGRWVVRVIVVPIIGTIISAGGLNIWDVLYPKPAPPLDQSKSPDVDARLLILEKQVDMLVVLFAARGARANGAAKGDGGPYYLLDHGGEKKPGGIADPDIRQWVSPKGESPDSLPKELPVPVSKSDERRVTVANSSIYLGRKAYVGQRGWEWTIYVMAEDNVLKQIECVTYTLHPTFANRVRRVCESEDVDKIFSLTASGWGTFTVEVLIAYKDGTKQRKSHQLAFVDGG